MRILFLDFDGVLNNSTSREKYGTGRFCAYNLANLKAILTQVHNIKVVVSSSWRVGRTIDQLISEFPKYMQMHKYIIGKTEDSRPEDLVDLHDGRGKVWSSCKRGVEIQRWIDSARSIDLDGFAILDDDGDMAHLMPFLVQTNGLDGLTRSKAEMTIKVLESNPLALMNNQGLPVKALQGSRAIMKINGEIVGYATDVTYQKELPQDSQLVVVDRLKMEGSEDPSK